MAHPDEELRVVMPEPPASRQSNSGAKRFVRGFLRPAGKRLSMIVDTSGIEIVRIPDRGRRSLGIGDARTSFACCIA